MDEPLGVENSQICHFQAGFCMVLHMAEQYIVRTFKLPFLNCDIIYVQPLMP